MTETETIKKIMERFPNGEHHKTGRCILWAASMLDKYHCKSCIDDMEKGHPVFPFIVDYTVRSIDGGLPRLDFYEVEKTHRMPVDKVTRMFWLADYYWGFGIYMSLTRVNEYATNYCPEFDSKEFCGEIVNQKKYEGIVDNKIMKLPRSKPSGSVWDF